MIFVNLCSQTYTLPVLEIIILSQQDKISSGYGCWSDMSIEDFLNGKVKSVNNYIIYGTNVETELFSIFFIFRFLMLLIVNKKYAL